MFFVPSQAYSGLSSSEPVQSLGAHYLDKAVAKLLAEKLVGNGSRAFVQKNAAMIPGTIIESTLPHFLVDGITIFINSSDNTRVYIQGGNNS